MPVPLAAGLYGVLLGLGFTTFILTFAVWALAGVSVALGDPALGRAVGLAFGAGRLLPVVVLAPVGGTEAAPRRTPRWPSGRAILRSLRAVDARRAGRVRGRAGRLRRWPPPSGRRPAPATRASTARSSPGTWPGAAGRARPAAQPSRVARHASRRSAAAGSP